MLAGVFPFLGALLGLAAFGALSSACLVDGVCYSLDDCPSGKDCNRAGCCVHPDGECNRREDCISSQVCDIVAGRCLNGDCIRDQDCDPNYVCEQRRCKPKGTGPLECPEDMVSVEDAFCMDIYEASRSDATEDSMGHDNSTAVSRPGVIPWYTNPMSGDVLTLYELACQTAGKRLCSRQEFFSACSGPDDSTYVFGNAFDREICNCVDTFCDDYCEEHGIPNCNTSANCGYTYNSFRIQPTGTFPGCTNSYGTFDLCGNVWEIVPSVEDSRGYEVRGGAFNCASARNRLACGFNAGWTDLYAGFRCCK